MTYIAAFKAFLKEAKLDVKPHQISGFDWIMKREKACAPSVKGGFLCDEMGLGKTILMLGAIMVNREASQKRTLIVLPLSLLQQWKGVFEKFLGHTPLIYHGAGVKAIDQDYLDEAPIVITTYGMIATRKDPNYISPLWNFKWGRVIFDEAHHMRNIKTNQFKGAQKLNTEIRWLVTGTPINNSHKDFCHLCLVLGLGPSSFKSIKAIKNTIKTYVLKRTKESTGIKMPSLNIHIEKVRFTDSEEEQLVKDIHSYLQFTLVTAQNVDEIIESLATHRLPMLVRARQGCVYPELVVQALRKKMTEFSLVEDDYSIANLKSHSKITAITDKIIKNKSTNKRKLVFCHYRDEIRKIAEILEKTGMKCAIVDGSTKKKDREKALSSDPDNENSIPDVLVVQIQTACEGLNLQHFAEIYFSTPHWNPAVEDQAIARAHRIGQNQSVDVYRFVMEFKSKEDTLTLDEYCLSIQEKKREIMQMMNQ